MATLTAQNVADLHSAFPKLSFSNSDFLGLQVFRDNAKIGSIYKGSLACSKSNTALFEEINSVIEKLTSNETFTYELKRVDLVEFSVFVSKFDVLPVFELKTDDNGNTVVTSKNESFIEKVYNHLS